MNRGIEFEKIILNFMDFIIFKNMFLKKFE